MCFVTDKDAKSWCVDYFCAELRWSYSNQCDRFERDDCPAVLTKAKSWPILASTIQSEFLAEIQGFCGSRSLFFLRSLKPISIVAARSSAEIFWHPGALLYGGPLSGILASLCHLWHWECCMVDLKQRYTSKLGFVSPWLAKIKSILFVFLFSHEGCTRFGLFCGGVGLVKSTRFTIRVRISLRALKLKPKAAVGYGAISYAFICGALGRIL